MRRFPANRVRVSAALTVLALVALQAAGNGGAEPPPTKVITAVAVNANGQAVNGYRVVPRAIPSQDLSGCARPSPAAVANDIYACDPITAAADVCWPAPASVLCVLDPWGKSLRRFDSPGALPPVARPATAMPFALLIDDGTRCVLSDGHDWGGRADGLVPVYGCGQQNWSLAVLADPAQDPPAAVNRSQPVWTVRLGGVGPPTTAFPIPLVHAVTTAWFAG
jgi:hypothetical protein